MISFWLPGPALGKERVKFVRATGRAYTPERTVNYEARVAHTAQIAMDGRPLLEGPVKLIVEIGVPVPQSKSRKWKAAALIGEIWPTGKPDTDNVLKALSDGCNMVVWVDDAQVCRTTVEKMYSDAPGVRVTVEPIITGETK